MSKRILLLRGINIGPNRRVAMPKLREALAAAGMKDVETYVQSGNVVVSSTSQAPAVGRKVKGRHQEAVRPRHRRDRLLSLVALTDAGLIGLLAAYRH